MPTTFWHKSLIFLLAIQLTTTVSLAARGGGGGGRGFGGGGGGFRGAAPARSFGGGGFRAAPTFSAPRMQAAPSRPAIGSSPTFSRPSMPRNFGQPQNMSRNIPRSGLNAPAQRNALNTRPQLGANRPGNPQNITTNRPNFQSGNRNPVGPGIGNRAGVRNNFNQNNVNRTFNQNRVANNYPNHWSPYNHAGMNMGYWNTGYNFGYGRNAFGAGYGVGPYGRYGAYGPYGYGLGYGLGYGGYGLGYGLGYGYGPYGYGFGPYGYYGRGWGALAAIGLASWALGSSYYGLGYGGYGNPYYGSGYGGYNYSQPIPAVSYVTDDTGAATTAAPDDANAQAADELLSAARNDFLGGNYEQALKTIDQAIEKTPGDTVLHEFRALTLFALHRYSEASATIYAVLAVSPGWNWSTMSSLYPSVAVYTEQLRALEQEVKAHPDVAATHFLLGYHYLTDGHADAAKKQLELASQLSSDDQVSRQLLRLLARPQPQAEGAAANSPENPAPATPTPPQSGTEKPSPKLVGDWKAKAQGNGSIALDLKDDGTFTWTYTQDGKPMKHEGNYELQGDVLIFDFKEGGGMIGQVKENNQGFHFAVLHGPENDPGLDFQKS